MNGLIGTKVGMTSIVNALGQMWPVTVVRVQPSAVTAVRTDAKHGYNAIQVGAEDLPGKRLTKPLAGAFKKSGIAPKRILKEFRVTAEEAGQAEVGKEIGAEFFEEGEFVDVHGRSIGKGFQGTIRRWNMSRGPESHGSMSHRRIGSIGASSFPSRTWPGHRMPGHMGDAPRTVQNLLVVRVLKEDGLILLKGAVPGAANARLTLTRAIKRRKIDLEAYFKAKSAGPSAKKEHRKPSKKK